MPPGKTDSAWVTSYGTSFWKGCFTNRQVLFHIKYCQQGKDSREKGDFTVSGAPVHILRTSPPQLPILKLLSTKKWYTQKFSVQL